jgi:5-bromo-4-chloroindolyl phosphate hydrolysis protein
MEPDSQTEREIRAARNQAMFRMVNDKMTELNASFAQMTGTYTIACECADTHCVATIEIAPEEYEAVRREPRHFAVLPGHVYPDVERVVEEFEEYTIVEKLRAAAEVAELTAEDS